MLTGEIKLSAIMGGEPLTKNQPLAAFVCQNSHLFLVREGDVLPKGQAA
jgi:hypothetical protein